MTPHEAVLFLKKVNQTQPTMHLLVNHLPQNTILNWVTRLS